MQTVWVKKGDDQRLIERKQLTSFRKAGFERCDPPVQRPVVEEPEPPKTNLITLFKDGRETQCDKAQIASLEAAGWSREAAKEGVPDGGNQQHGREVDQEHGSGDDGEELVDDSDGLEQRPRQRRKRTYRSKRGDDQDS